MTNELRDKFILYLNSALAMENAALERVQRRLEQTILEDVRQQLQRHLEETKQHQERLRQIIRNIEVGEPGITPTEEKGELPIAVPPQSNMDIKDRPRRARAYAIGRGYDSRKCRGYRV
jgi:cell division septum initiation protein DivIVA